MRARRSWLPASCAGALLIVNLVIVAELFGVEYSAYIESSESAFIANARVMAEHPGEWGWWPLWSGGMPYENAYPPLTQWAVATISLLTGLSPARSFHIVTAAFYALGAPALFWMALELSRRVGASFFAGLAYSCFSLAPMLMPEVAVDVGGLRNLRRLHVLAFYGGAPHTLALTLLPVSVVFFSRALATDGAKWRILAGVSAGAIALTNAFGATTLAVAVLCLLAAHRCEPWWKGPSIVAAIGVVAWCWISPWMSPAMIRAIRENSATAGGDFRYTTGSWVAAALLIGGFFALRRVLHRRGAGGNGQVLVLFTYTVTAVVMTWQWWGVSVIPQPHRYQLEMEAALLLTAVFAGAASLDRLPKRARAVVAAVVFVAIGLQSMHAFGYARELIQPVDPAGLVEYRIAKWMDENRRGERAFISGSSSLWYNVFTGNPQYHGGHEPFVANSFVRTAAFTIYTGMNAGSRDAEYSVFWLKALGARAVSVSGPNGRQALKAFTNPRKLEGVLREIWREGDDVIYEVPGRSASLAHVMPASAVPARTPIHGLDIGPVEAYVAALDDARYPEAAFEWKGMSEASIRARVERGQVIAIQVSYDDGWEARRDGERLVVRRDAIGQMVIECQGACEITLKYTGGTERIVTRTLSGLALVAAVVYGMRRRKSETPEP